MTSFFSKQAPAPRKWHQKKRFQLPMLLAGILVIPGWLFVSTAAGNLRKAPPVGTVYNIPHNHHLGYRFVTDSAGRNVWTRFCIMARGGTLTLTRHLLFREDVPFITLLLSLNKSAVFTYKLPPHGVPNMAMEYPWCPDGLTQSVPLSKFFPSASGNGYDSWKLP